ncbi:LacI family DNA-binding transcriptional regulator [Streptomyces sp. NPDC059783]|uniref:LacI family DNA-binding transcriptional regulator n=1 Tax=Streptomyces sp. NPDC059783 TaxID=3346944 RepID=UPI0036510F73
MGYAEKRGSYYRARYKTTAGTYGTVKDDQGRTIRFERRRDAKQAADAAEVKVRAGARVDRSRVPTLGEFVQAWWAAQELAESTMENYRNHIQGHILPYFGDRILSEITPEDVAAWARGQRELYAPSSVQTYRSILHLIFEDARKKYPEGLTSNPAAQQRNRGRRAGRARHRGPEKVITDPLGALLIAERAALMTGRPDEFVQTITESYTGLRTGEITGLDRAYIRPAAIRVEQQLYELSSGSHVLCPPKDDSYRTVDIPGWLRVLLLDQAARTQAPPCDCHQVRTVFRSASLVTGAKPPTRAAVAAAAGVSGATVSRAQARPDLVSAAARARVAAALEELGAGLPTGGDRYVPHWGREDYRRAVSTPAASGWYPSAGDRSPARPVCIDASGQWPGTVLHGRHSSTQATACWAPVAAGLTPHGRRHSHASWLEDIGTPKVLIDERMGHMDSSVSARYKHVMPAMRHRLLVGLTELWQASLAARATMNPRSPVPVLDRLLQEHEQQQLSQNSPRPAIARALDRLHRGVDLAIYKMPA